MDRDLVAGGDRRRWAPCLRHGLLSAGLYVKGVQRGNVESLEISNIAGDHGQTVNCSRSGDHRVLDEIVRPPMYEARPGPEGSRIHTYDIVRLRNLLQPGLDLNRLGLVPFTRDFYA